MCGTEGAAMTDESERLWASRPVPHRVLLQAAVQIGKARVLLAVGIAVLCFGFGVVSGVRLSSYRGHVADQDYAEQRQRLVHVEQFLQQQFPKALLTTRMQAAVAMDNKEKERRQVP